MYIQIILILTILILLILFLIFSTKKIDIEKMFNNTTTNLNNIGGLLVSNFSISSFETFLHKNDMLLSDTAQCAAVNRKTCGAYSYIRKDLLPMLFQAPGINLNVPCGIIMNPQKLWPLITLTSIVDADTNRRSACTNETSSDFFIRNPFKDSGMDLNIFKNLLFKYGPDHPFVTKKYAIYIPNYDMGASKLVICNGDLKCMYQNSGGNIDLFLLFNSNDFSIGKYKDCFDYAEISPDQVSPIIKSYFPVGTSQPDGYLIQLAKPDCSVCTKPFLCVADQYRESAPNGADTEKYKTIEESDRIATYIGKDGSGFGELITPTIDIGNVNIAQCRFEKKDWNVWIKVLKNWYKKILEVIKPDNSLPENLNYMSSNPLNPSYLENEVNIYINPDISSKEFKKQNEIWQDSIIGFYYTYTTCEDQLKELDGIETTYNNTTFNNIIDRCDKYWNLDDDTMTTDKRREWEEKNINYAKELVHKVSELFNEKYNKNIPIFKCKASNSSFPNYKDLNNALNSSVKFADIFEKEK